MISKALVKGILWVQGCWGLTLSYHAQFCVQKMWRAERLTYVESYWSARVGHHKFKKMMGDV